MKKIVMNGKEYTVVPMTGNSAPAKTGAEGTIVMVLDGTKCLLVPVQKASSTKAPVTTSTTTSVEEKNKVPPVAPVTRQPTPSWVWIVISVLVILLIASLLMKITKTPITGNTGNAPAISNPVGNATSPKDVIMDYGAFGSYKSEYDSNLGKYVVGQWEGSRIRAGLNLADMKTDSSSVSFVLPFDAEINNSAGNFFVNGTQWKLGNPVEDSTGNTIIPAGSTITISYDDKNDSAGWMIIFQ